MPKDMKPSIARPWLKEGGVPYSPTRSSDRIKFSAKVLHSSLPPESAPPAPTASGLLSGVFGRLKLYERATAMVDSIKQNVYYRVLAPLTFSLDQAHIAYGDLDAAGGADVDAAVDRAVPAVSPPATAVAAPTAPRSETARVARIVSQLNLKLNLDHGEKQRLTTEYLLKYYECVSPQSDAPMDLSFAEFVHVENKRRLDEALEAFVRTGANDAVYLLPGDASQGAAATYSISADYVLSLAGVAAAPDSAAPDATPTLSAATASAQLQTEQENVYRTESLSFWHKLQVLMRMREKEESLQLTEPALSPKDRLSLVLDRYEFYLLLHLGDTALEGATGAPRLALKHIDQQRQKYHFRGQNRYVARCLLKLRAIESGLLSYDVSTDAATFDHCFAQLTKLFLLRKDLARASVPTDPWDRVRFACADDLLRRRERGELMVIQSSFEHRLRHFVYRTKRLAENTLKPRHIPPALAPAEAHKMKELLAQRNFEATLVTSQVQAKDLRTLLPGQWVNDEIITYYATLINERSTQMHAPTLPLKKLVDSVEYLNVHVFNHFFYNNISGSSGYKSVKRWTRRFDIFAKDVVIIPINQNGNHWICAGVLMKEKKVVVLDSLGGKNQRIVDNILNYLREEHADKKKTPLDTSDWTGVFDNVPRQNNGYDCGIFTCAFMDCLSRLGHGYDFSQENINYLRSRMILDINNKAITPLYD